jgi:hypothetical protein
MKGGSLNKLDGLHLCGLARLAVERTVEQHTTRPRGSLYIVLVVCQLYRAPLKLLQMSPSARAS